MNGNKPMEFNPNDFHVMSIEEPSSNQQVQLFSLPGVHYILNGLVVAVTLYQVGDGNRLATRCCNSTIHAVYVVSGFCTQLSDLLLVLLWYEYICTKEANLACVHVRACTSVPSDPQNIPIFLLFCTGTKLT